MPFGASNRTEQYWACPWRLLPFTAFAKSSNHADVVKLAYEVLEWIEEIGKMLRAYLLPWLNLLQSHVP